MHARTIPMRMQESVVVVDILAWRRCMLHICWHMLQSGKSLFTHSKRVPKYHRCARISPKARRFCYLSNTDVSTGMIIKHQNHRYPPHLDPDVWPEERKEAGGRTTSDYDVIEFDATHRKSHPLNPRCALRCARQSSSHTRQNHSRLVID